MTVREFIAYLQTLEQDRRIVIAGYEGGYNDIQKTYTAHLKLNDNTEWYYGAHNDVDMDEEYDEVAYVII